MKKIKRVVDPAKITQLEFSSESCSMRTSETGLSLVPVGAVGTRVRVGISTAVMVFNAGASVAYVRFGDAAVSSPTGPGDGIPIASGEKLVINSGASEYVIASSASVFAYSSSEE